jgi:MFS transporter, ACS family, DAL5 transporter family protein
MSALMPEKVAVSEDFQSTSSNEKNLHEGLTKEVLDNTEVITAAGNIITKDGLVLNTKAHYTNLNGSDHIFADPEVAAYYVKVYEKAHYECRHVFDPTLTWTKEEEKKIVRKLDWRGTLPSSCMCTS